MQTLKNAIESIAAYARWMGVSALFALQLVGAGAAHAGLPIAHWVQDDGVQVWAVNSPALPMVDVHIDFDAGSRRDPPAQAGLAQAAALMLQKGVRAQGEAPALDENALGERWADLGAALSLHAGQDAFSLNLRSLTEPALLDAAVALAARQLAQPAWPAQVWARERAAWSASLREALTRPGVRAAQAFDAAVYGAHPYGQQTTEASLAAIDVADLRAWQARALQPCHARVSVVGALDAGAVRRLVQRLLGLLQPLSCSPLPIVPEVAPLAAAQALRLRMDAAQAQVWLGQPGLRRNDPDFLPVLVGNHILGAGGFSSLLTQVLREQRGLTYGVASHFSPGRHAGAFSVVLQTRPDQAELALSLVRAEVARFVQQGPSAAQLSAAQDELINGFALRIDSNRKLLDNVANIAWNDLPLDYLDGWTARVAALSPADVQRAMARVLDPQRMVSLILGPQGAP